MGVVQCADLIFVALRGTMVVVSAAPQPSYEQLQALLVETLAQNAELRSRMAALEARLNQSSKNSSRPPSSDSPYTKTPAKPRSSRTGSGRKPGKQKGAGGSNLRLVDDPDEVVPCPPAACGGCGADLADQAPVKIRRRQVLDVPPPPPRPYVTEYQVQTLCCPKCGGTTEGAAPGDAAGHVQYGPGVRARAAWLTCGQFLPVRRAGRVLAALLGVGLSTGFVASVRGQAARLLEQAFLPAVRALIAAAPVAHADETCARAEGALRYLHIACTEFLTAIHAGDRTAEAIDGGGVWPAFTGVLMRDGYGGYTHLTGALHAWCGAHTIRDLRSVHDGDPDGQCWADCMANTLVLANITAGKARADGRDQLTADELTTIRNRYHSAVALGWDQNPRDSDPLAEKARALLRRCERHEDMILRFTVDLRVPFTNNVAERDARPTKIQQKTSGGCWRTLTGLADFAIVQSYLSTAGKWGLDGLDVLTRLFTTGAWLPPGPTPTTAA
jgi:transposase